ncbi:hypothetical protein C8J57DRAFT_1246033 [Mycena rebaudengoi]|jgi:hypothetical protein|nr:hypothetical protein C8J57DRAFT_1246033 [Mycena rebaudengoi]
MGVPKWTTPEQCAWLEARLDDYLAARASRKVPEFWRTMLEEWILQFPVTSEWRPGYPEEQMEGLQVRKISGHVDFTRLTSGAIRSESKDGTATMGGEPDEELLDLKICSKRIE